MRSSARNGAIVGLIVMAVVCLVGTAAAQVPDTAAARRALEQRLGRSVSQGEIAQRLRSSGLSLAQLRTQLQQMGLDPSLADYYFNLPMEGGAAQQVAAPEMVDALQKMGVGIATAYGNPLAGSDTTTAASSEPADTSARRGSNVDTTKGLPIFGRDFFRRRLPGMQPPRTGPVDADYRVAPGDQLGVILSGDVEASYAMDVAREGYIVLPDVGQVSVAGLTLREVERRLADRFGKVYSGVGPDSAAATRIQVSLGRLHTNLVYVMGEVEDPGAVQTSALSTILDVLYEAGGPTMRGSLRDVQVRRDGRVAVDFDVYRYLLTGDGQGDVRLQQGDVVFVPVTGTRVAMKGAVRRPAVYEVRPGEGLRTVIGFAGGLEPDAVTRRIQIDRILPPDQRRPGVDRVLEDVSVEASADSSDGPIALKDGDIVTVFAISDARRHRVTLRGQVHRPGVYEWSPGMTLWGLIGQADGLGERAYTSRAHIYRLNPADGTRQLLRVSLERDSAGRPVQDVPLADRDSVVVFNRETLANTQVVHIAGFVKHPGTYPLSDGMTIRDLVLAAGGFSYGADRSQAEVARVPDVETRTDTVAHVFRVSLGAEDPGAVADTSDGVPAWLPQPGEFRLQHDDRVFIRKARGYEPVQSVVVTGEVMEPGVRVLDSRETRLTDLLERAGGVTPEAYVPGAQLYRRGDLVAVNLERALRDPASRFNFMVENGDSLHIPKYDPTVLVTGSVAFETRVPFVSGRGLDYYVAQAGGYTDAADRGRVSVTYQNGQRAIVHEILLFRRKPAPGPGSVVTVPALSAVAQQPFDVKSFVLAALPAVTTLLLALAQLK